MQSGYPDSYYLATARGVSGHPALRGSISADACVIGGGFTGLSAALHLAERGLRVVLLEAERIGWGASGRNGGQIGSGQRMGQDELERRYGTDTAKRLWDLSEEAKGIVRQRIARHAIECDLKSGQLITASKPAHAARLRRQQEKLARDYAYAQTRYVAPAELPRVIGSEAFYGGLLDSGALHLHPLNFALGLARAAREAGVTIHEHSTVLGYDSANPTAVRLAGGAVRARHVILACDGYLGRLEPRVASRIMPINNFMIATAPLGEERARSLIPDDVCVHDTRFVVNYFRLSADRRLLFGGGENYRAGFPADIKAFVRPYMLGVFPQLADVGIDYGWGGALGVTRTRLPHVGRLPPDVFFAHGFSGHGISIGVLAGMLIAEAVTGTAERFDVFRRVAPPSFPGGTLLRWPMLVLGMLYYSLRDRL